MFEVVSISIGSMKGLHFNMEKGLAYGILSLGNIQVCLSLSLSHKGLAYGTLLINMNEQMCKQRQNKQLLASSPD